MQIQSGYKTITPIQLANLLWALNQHLLDQRDVRVYFACFALVAVREAAARHRLRCHRKPRETCCYRANELERLTGLGGAAVRRALRQLKRLGLVNFCQDEIRIAKESISGSAEMQEALACRRSPRRPIPVPRSVLRFLAQTKSVSLAKTLLAYLVRGLSITRRTGEICGKGTVKASWIARTVTLSQRAVKYAQAELRALNWISKDTQSYQRKLNRDGAYFVINLTWTLGAIPVVKLDKCTTNFAPPPSEIRPLFAPPYKNKETSIERDQHQESHHAEPCVAGDRGKGGNAGKLPEPSLWNIYSEDLFQLGRLEKLYFEASERGWLKDSQSMALNFIAAAVKAREEGTDPARLFVSIVKRGLWQHISHGHEDHARRALARYRESDQERFSCRRRALRPLGERTHKAMTGNR